MRRLRPLLLVPALVVLLAGGTVAQGAPKVGALDPSFGSGGIVTVEVAQEADTVEATVTAEGRIYVLAGPLLLAFEGNGAPAVGFGLGGRVSIAPALGEGAPSDFAVDSQGRILVAGSARLPSSAVLPVGKPTEAYVIRLLPDGSRDPSFGDGGEVDTDFGLPAMAGEARSVSANSIMVDAQDRPIVGGGFGPETACSYSGVGGRSPYIARLTASGAPDPTFAGTSYTTLKGTGGVGGLAQTQGGNFAVFSYACPTPPRYESRGPEYSVFAESGAASPVAQQVPLGYHYAPLLIDPRGRVVELESSPPAGESADTVVRYLPNGDPDPSFARHGRFVLRHKPHYADAIAVDAKSRPIIAMAAKRIVLRRFLADGKVDKRFGPEGQLTGPGPTPSVIALDAQGRIYTVSLSKGAARTSVRIARFIPGP
jgi:uncharacterized delta-60 repeat protein